MTGLNLNMFSSPRKVISRRIDGNFFFPKINAVLGGQKAFREWLTPHDIYTGGGEDKFQLGKALSAGQKMTCLQGIFYQPVVCLFGAFYH